MPVKVPSHGCPTPEATDEFVAWSKTLDPKSFQALNNAIDVLHEMGPQLRDPTVKRITPRGQTDINNLKELRVGPTIRAFFVFDPRQVPILLTGEDKMGQPLVPWYNRMIGQATKLYETHLNELRSEGLLPPLAPGGRRASANRDTLS